MAQFQHSKQVTGEATAVVDTVMVEGQPGRRKRVVTASSVGNMLVQRSDEAYYEEGSVVTGTFQFDAPIANVIDVKVARW